VLVAQTTYYTDNLTSINTTYWTQNGVLTAGAGGLTSTNTGDGGSLISKIAVPDGTSDYEVRTTLNIPNPPPGPYDEEFYVYLRASSNTLYSSPFGAGYVFQVNEPPACPSGPCSGYLQLYKWDSTITHLAGAWFTFYPGSVLRAVINHSGSQIAAFVDSGLVIWTSDSDSNLSSGQPGIGAVDADPNNTIKQVQLATLYRGSPQMPSVGQIGVTAQDIQVSMQWPAATESGGPGVAFYQVFRDGAQIQLGSSLSFTDPALIPATNYTYKICAYDFDLNSACDTIPVTTPPASGPVSEREIGVRSTGAYWGGSGENIDMQSGNLNYTVPILKVMGRGSWSVPFNLSYNSLNWRQDSGGTWQLGADLGYGYGWKLMAGSLLSYSTPSGGVAFMFTDATGAEYLLTQNSGGVYSSPESVYVSYDSNTGELHFNDGSFWVMGCTSAGTEQDAGTGYPTLMEDSNGNQVIIAYKKGKGATWVNSSSRISTIEDVRGNGNADYTFTYNTDSIPHLTGITNTIHTAEKYSFAYLSNYSLKSPFGGSSYGTMTVLESSKATGVNMTTYYTYDTAAATASCTSSGTGTSGAGELTQITTPYCGHLRWTYTTGSPLSGTTYNEIQNRYLSMTSGAAESEIELIRGNDASYQIHSSATLDDSPASAEKYWAFETEPGLFNSALELSYEERTLSTHTPLSHLDLTWAQTPTSLNPYIGTTVTKLDPGQTYEADKQTTQTLDQYGNLLTMQIYNFGSGAVGSLARTYTNAYLGGSSYTSRYIFNRLTTSKVTDGTNLTTLASNTYDNGVSAVTGAYEHDDTNYPATFVYRGNVYTSTTLTTSATISTDMTGNTTATYVNGVYSTVTTNSSTNYAAPSQVTTNTLTSTMNWSGFLGLSSATDPNGDTGSISYDSQARPSSVTSPYGAVTSYTYNDTESPPNHVAVTNGHSATTVMDGFGRTIQTATGYGSTTVSIVDARYAPCGCSPLGKLSQQSQPYAPGGSDAWTVYHYDASGRTTSTVLPDGSITSYQYQGNVVTVTDPAGKWKTFTMDALGNLTSAVESDPSLGNVTTTYTYDVLNHLIGVSMPRGTTTQTRTFNYNNGRTVTAFLQSATNPENGTVSYTYDSLNRLASKTDAKNQQLTYQYDSYNRLTSVTWANSPNGAQVLRTYYYDTNPLDSSGFSQNTLGRLAAVKYPNIAQNPDAGSTPLAIQMNEMYSYVASTGAGAGLPSAKRLQVNQVVYYQDNNNNTQHGTVTVNLDSTSTYNNEGKVTAMTYPSTINGSDTPVPGPTYNYSYDSMYRLSGMTSGSTTVVSGVSYNAANQLLSMSYSGINETRGYNVLNQLTSLNNGSANLTYTYPTGTNNGKLSSMYNAVSGETVTYTYDSLNRIATANGSGWGEQYTFDGFGNLTEKHVTAGSGPSMSVGVNESTNQLVGTTYDANGNAYQANVAYDVENHVYALVGESPYPVYSYDAQSRRIFLWSGTYDSENNSTNYSVVVYSPSGQKLGTYLFIPGEYSKNGGAYQAFIGVSLPSSDTYFGGRRLAAMDQLGSVGTFYPWGEAKGNTNPQDTWSFATYWRDSANGLDYANNRYYSNAYGRFMTPDPYTASGGPADPQSWNRYSYTRGDPVSRLDPAGLQDQGGGEGGGACDPSDPNCTGLQYCPDGSVILIGGTCPNGTPVQTTNRRQPGQSASSLPSFLADAEARVAADLMKAGCGSDFKNASKDISKLGQIGFSNQGTLLFSTDSQGNIVPTKGTPGLGKYNGFTGSINLNYQVNWLLPNQTAALLNGNPYTPDLLGGQAAALGVPSVTADQLIDLTILHELSHYNGALGNPDNDPTVEERLWADCIK
jgi:RHS repeat-associated protein